MKSISLLIACLFMGSIAFSQQAATVQPAQNDNKTKTQVDNHGQKVSTVAKETPSGPGKGQIVSAAARDNNGMAGEKHEGGKKHHGHHNHGKGHEHGGGAD